MRLSRKWKRQRWIKENNGERQYLNPDYDFIFWPWDLSKGLTRTTYRDLLTYTRPLIHGEKQIRVAKDTVYHIIHSHLSKMKIKGQYIGLAAAHIPEIYVGLSPHIVNKFTTCQIKFKDYYAINEWMELVRLAYVSRSGNNKLHPEFEVHRGNILDLMESTDKEYSIIDLDLMSPLDTSLINRISSAVNSCASQKSVVAVWHTIDRRRGSTASKLEEKIRPRLVNNLKEKFTIESYTKVSYSEAQPGATSGYPMRVDILSLQRL